MGNASLPAVAYNGKTLKQSENLTLQSKISYFKDLLKTTGLDLCRKWSRGVVSSVSHLSATTGATGEQ